MSSARGCFLGTQAWLREQPRSLLTSREPASLPHPGGFAANCLTLVRVSRAPNRLPRAPALPVRPMLPNRG